MPEKTDSTSVPKKPAPKRVIAIKPDLIPRVLAKAGELQQNPNRFVNLCVEGILDAMDAVGVYEIPILQLYRTLKGKPLPTFKTILILCSVLAPEFSRMDLHERKLLFGLMDKHDSWHVQRLLRACRPDEQAAS